MGVFIGILLTIALKYMPHYIYVMRLRWHLLHICNGTCLTYMSHYDDDQSMNMGKFMKCHDVSVVSQPFFMLIFNNEKYFHDI